MDGFKGRRKEAEDNIKIEGIHGRIQGTENSGSKEGILTFITVITFIKRTVQITLRLYVFIDHEKSVADFKCRPSSS